MGGAWAGWGGAGRECAVQRLPLRKMRKRRSSVWLEGGRDCSHPPEEQVVGAVVPPHRLAAIGQPEVLVAVPAADDEQVGLSGQEGGGAAVG